MPRNKPPVMVRLYAIAYPVTALGPGVRVVIWVSGCGKRCSGCISPEMQDPQAGKAIEAAQLAQRLLALDENLAGITISGGEPFDQAGALCEMLSEVRARRPKWSVIIYSGYVMDEIRNSSERARLLQYADVVIDGPYNRDIESTSGLTGSGNQGFHFLTDLGNSMKQEMESFSRHAVNVGFGPGLFNMIIGVTEQTQRREISRALFPDSTEKEGCQDIC